MSEPESGVIQYYNSGVERRRLLDGVGRLELARTQEILRRHMPGSPADVLDVGGAVGVYSAWLASEGYRVHLIDPVPEHVAAARESGTFTADLGDARELQQQDESFDLVLLFGPLYHLLDAVERAKAIAEAARVVRPGGIVACAFITRWAPLLDGLRSGWIYEPGLIEIVEQFSSAGHTALPGFVGGGFGGIAYFHHPDDAGAELDAGGLEVLDLAGVEGPGCWLPDFDERWDDLADREVILRAARMVEHEPAFMASSAHLLGVARRRG